MIDCHIIENKGLVAVVTIEGADFWDSLNLLKDTIPARDREYIEEDKVWHVRNPENHQSIRAIENALKTYKNQTRMF